HIEHAYVSRVSLQTIRVIANEKSRFGLLLETRCGPTTSSRDGHHGLDAAGSGFFHAVMPPSTTRVLPVTKLLCSEARNRAERAISWGVAWRCRGMRLLRKSAASRPSTVLR